MTREIVVTGANGWIGGYVGAALQARGWQVTGVSRTPDLARARRPEWTWIDPGPRLEQAVSRSGVVLNLAGRHPFEQPWTAEYIDLMRSSRIDLTRRIAAALAGSAAEEKVLVSGSGYPVYGDAGERTLTEDAPLSRDLVSGAMDADWEAATGAAASDGVRRVLVRIALTLGDDGGAFPLLREPFDAGAGIVLGSGRQWLPWIHLTDAVRLLVEIVENPRYRGAVNVAAPGPVRYADFAASLARRLGVPCATAVRADAVAAQLGGACELVLSSIRMVPELALAAGFAFTHPTIDSALDDLVAAAVVSAAGGPR